MGPDTSGDSADAVRGMHGGWGWGWCHRDRRRARGTSPIYRPLASHTRPPPLGSPACASFALALCRAPPLHSLCTPLHPSAPSAPSAPLCSSGRARRASGPRESVERLGGAYERRGAPTAAPARHLDGVLRSHDGRQAAEPALEIDGVGGAEPRLLGRLATLYQDLRGVRGRVMGGGRACHRRVGVGACWHVGSRRRGYCGCCCRCCCCCCCCCCYCCEVTSSNLEGSPRRTARTVAQGMARCSPPFLRDVYCSAYPSLVCLGLGVGLGLG